MMMSVFADRFVEAASISRTRLADAYLIGTGVSGMLISYGGSLFDRFGARLFSIIACILFGTAVMLMSQVDRVAAQAQRVLGESPLVTMGVFALGFFAVRFLGQGMVTVGSRSMLAKWWDRKRGLVISLSGLAIAAGFSVAPVILNWEAERFGWRGAWIVNGGLLMTAMPLIVWLFFRDNPEECGLRMDGPYAKEADEPRNADMVIHRDFNLQEAVRTYSFWVFALGMAAQALYATSYTFHVLDIGREKGIESTRILSFFALALFFSIPTNLLCGYIIEYVRLRFVLILLGLAGTVMAVGALHLPALWAQWLLIGGMGVAWGTYPVLTSVTFARYFGRRHLGAISGMAMSFMVWGSALGPAFFARGQAYSGSYDAVFRVMGASYLLVAVFAFFAQNPQRRVAPGTASGDDF